MPAATAYATIAIEISTDGRKKVKMAAYYNEFDPFAAAWLRELIKAGEIAPGEVDERSITEVVAADLRGFDQCHFFAGIGGWSRALRIAGWPDDRPVWTGSCPCQSFSSAGKGEGRKDDRHLWPTWHGLIRECGPATVFGEQVASAIAFGWWDEVAYDLETAAYACAAAVLPACAAGAPHRRDRLWFVAHRAGAGLSERSFTGTNGKERSCGIMAHAEDQRCRETGSDCTRPAQRAASGGSLDNAQHPGPQGQPGHDSAAQGWQEPQRSIAEAGFSDAMGDPEGERPNGRQDHKNKRRRKFTPSEPNKGFWDSGEWLACADEKDRLIEPCVPLLANGVSNRVGKLRGYGNAIVPQIAAEFIKAAA